jgi:hypothetical protein
MRHERLVRNLSQIFKERADNPPAGGLAEMLADRRHHMRRRDQEEIIEATRRFDLGDLRGERSGETLLGHLVRVMARRLGVVGGGAAVERGAGAVTGQFCGASMREGRIERALTVERMICRRAHQARMLSIGDEDEKTALGHRGTSP